MIQRSAAEVLGPQVLQLINDPGLAPEIAALLADQLRRRDGAAAAVGRFVSNIRVRPNPSTVPAKIKGPTS